MCSTKVIGVTVSHDDRMDPLEGNAHLYKSFFDDCITGLLGETRVDQGDTTFVFEHIHIDVTEAWN